MTLSNPMANKIMESFFANKNFFVGLHTANPLTGGMSTYEIGGPTYARQVVRWGSASNRGVSNSNEIVFSGVPLTTIPYLGIWDLARLGTLVASVECDPPYTAQSNGSTVRVPVDELVIELV